MARLPGDPGPLRWLAFALGFRLPDDNLDWVKHELTDAGWRLRTIVRHLAVIVMVGLILAGSIFSVAAYADDIRTSRLRQHGLDVPNDPDLGHPAH